MVNFIIKRSCWSMITPEAKERMMDEGDVVVFENGATETWTKKRVRVPVNRASRKEEVR
jgi:hypothetical protein